MVIILGELLTREEACRAGPVVGYRFAWFASQICVFLSPKRDKLSQKEGKHYKGGMICEFVV